MVTLTVIIVLLGILLVAIVLMQKSKGGGLAAGFQSSNQIMGAPKTADFLEKATWTLMSVIAVLCIVCSLITSNTSGNGSASSLQEQISDEAPVMPESTPEEAAPAQDAAPAAQEDAATDAQNN
jgi:preprotein translocase subunit SecG